MLCVLQARAKESSSNPMGQAMEGLLERGEKLENLGDKVHT